MTHKCMRWEVYMGCQFIEYFPYICRKLSFLILSFIILLLSCEGDKVMLVKCDGLYKYRWAGRSNCFPHVFAEFILKTALSLLRHTMKGSQNCENLRVFSIGVALLEFLNLVHGMRSSAPSKPARILDLSCLIFMSFRHCCIGGRTVLIWPQFATSQFPCHLLGLQGHSCSTWAGQAVSVGMMLYPFHHTFMLSSLSQFSPLSLCLGNH